MAEFAYRITMSGQDDALKALKEVEGTAASGSKNMGGGFDKIAGKLKAITADTNTFAVASAAGYTQVTSHVFGLAQALGQGGLFGAFGLAAAGIGVAIGIMDQWKKEEDEAKKKTEELDRITRDFSKNAIDSWQKAKGAAAQYTAENLRAVMLSRDAYVQGLRGQLDALEAVAKNEKVANSDRMDAARAAHELQVRLTAAEKDLSDDKRKYEQQRIKETAKEAREAEAQNSQDRADALRKREEEEKASADKILQQQIEDENKRIDMLLAMDAHDKQVREQHEKDLAAVQTKANVDAAKAADIYRLNVAKAADAEENHRRALAAKNAEMAKSTEQMLVGASVNTTYAASMAAAGPVVTLFTDQLRMLGEVNASNYREQLNFSENLGPMLAKEMQARSASLAADAAGKAIFEAAETVREEAEGFGSLAIYDAAGAANHFTSAASHAVSAGIYSTLSGAGIAVAGGLGAARGTIIPLTKEEKQQQGGGGSSNSTGAPASGTYSSSGGRTSGGNGQTVVNITEVYQAGAIAPDDNQRLGRVVAQGVSQAGRDWYSRRMMQGGAP